MFTKPVIILAAPRSGSTLLFETLAHCGDLWTIGGESHAVFESIPELQVSQSLLSNRLTDQQFSAAVGERLVHNFRQDLQDRNGSRYSEQDPAKSIRLLEKTPKNALRVSFLNAVFPDALFIYLYRDPCENISSIMEAWRSNRWVTYEQLPGWQGHWSLLLPPDWQKLAGRPLEEIAAFQWKAANQYILKDLAELPANRWTTISYRQLVNNTEAEIRRLCEFASITFDEHLESVTASTLPHSRYTQTPPASGKWKKNSREISRIIPSLQHIISKIDELDNASNTTEPGLWYHNRNHVQPARNAPCPCGSGKKFKRCHGSAA